MLAPADNAPSVEHQLFNEEEDVDMLRIISRETKSKFQLTIGVFSIAFVMSVIEKFTEFLNTLMMQCERRYKW